MALAGGGQGVDVIGPAGDRLTHVAIPDPMCTSVCFGGEDLRDLYIVSGSDDAPSDHHGAVYRVRSDVAGLPVAPAKVSITD